VRKVFWIYLVLMGLVMVWYIPPFQKPDEIVHFQNVAVIVGGKTWSIENRFVDLPVRLKALEISHRFENKFDSKRVWEKDVNKAISVFGYNITWKSYISYFPVEIGMWIGSLTPYPVLALYFGRMMGLILFLFCVWLSLKLIPMKYSGLVVAYALIPMVIHQVTEVSYDGLLLCLAPLILSVFLKILRPIRQAQDKQAQGKLWKWFGLLTVLILLFVTVKSGYYLMLFLLPILIWNKYRNEIIDRPWIVSVVMFLMIPVIIIFINFLNNNVGGGTSGLVNGGYQLEILKRDPILIVKILADTWEAKMDFYIKGMFGYFGWLDYEFDLYQYLIVAGMIMAFLINVIISIKRPVVGWFGLIVTGLIIVGTYVLIEFGFFMQWTVVGSQIIEGVQGRYLLPLVPLLLFWITQFFVLVGKKRSKMIVFAMCGFVLMSGMIDKIFYRYYDLSTNFRNVDEMFKALKDADEQKLKKTYLSSNKKMSINFHTSDGDVLGGFDVITERNNNMIVVPYRYSIKDKNCTHELIWGYIDSSKLNKDNLYAQIFDGLKLGYRDICLEIEPIVVDGEQKYFDYVLVEEEPLIKLKFLISEIKYN